MKDESLEFSGFACVARLLAEVAVGVPRKSSGVGSFFRSQVSGFWLGDERAGRRGQEFSDRREQGACGGFDFAAGRKMFYREVRIF